MEPGPPSRSSSAHGGGQPSVYELWRELDFEAVMTSNQDVYERVIENMGKAAEEKSELLAFVKQFTGKVREKQSCGKAEIEELLGYFKRVFAGMMERCLYGEQAYSGLYRSLGGLPDPTPHLLTLSMAQANIAKLEAELAANHTAAAELQGLSENGRKDSEQNAKLREELAALAQQVKDRELAADALRAKIRTQADDLAAAEDRCRQLEDRCLAVTDSLARLQTKRDDDADGLAEETALLQQQLADKDAALAELRLRVDGQGRAERREAEMDLEMRLLELTQRFEYQQEQTATAEAAAAALRDEAAALRQERGELKEAEEYPGADDAEMRKARYERLVADLGLAGEVGDAADEVELLMVMKQKQKALKGEAAKQQQHAAHQGRMLHLLERQKADLERERVNRDAQIEKLQSRLDLLVGGTSAPQPAPHARDAAIDEVFDVAALFTEVGDDVHVVMDDAADAQAQTVRLLTTQREVLKDKVAELEGNNAALSTRLTHALARTADVEAPAPPPAPGQSPSQPPAAPRGVQNGFDAVAYRTLRIVNSNPITRGFVAVYFVLLHLLVSLVLYYASMGSTAFERTAASRKDTF
eukprot:TRINITY_DN8628_c0_g1_i1.p1 TRINITY_DN8628_c0_g1~~TRINITY_DN8628_c0_g1_i1.p1  ORF type:complete len:588 (+),score=221.78 TRINITY_DN8628_c0_g1_i1:85-1848(+)